MSHLQRLVRNHESALMKSASYYVVHIVVAACVVYAVTGSWLTALTLSLLEPSVQVVAYFFHEKAWARIALARLRTTLKTLSYYVVHLTVAAGVAYAVTGNWLEALTLSLLEPTVQMAFFFLHEKIWERRARNRAIPPIACASASKTCPQRAACTHMCALKAC